MEMEMKLFSKGKDGGPESTVTGYWLIEWKRLFSIVLLKFEGASREAYHNHAFNSVSWLLKGELMEYTRGDDPNCILYSPHIVPIRTYRETLHKVNSNGISWVLSFRGPWVDSWNEITEVGEQTLVSGRKIING